MLDQAWQGQLRRGTGVAVTVSPTPVTLFITRTVSPGNLRASEADENVLITRARWKGGNVSVISPAWPTSTLTSGHAGYWAVGGHVAVPLSEAGSAQKGRGRTGLPATEGPLDPPIMQP